ncbi:hypothetical protein [Roseovarius sp. MMSF_3359]|uniref:hypothetical protein n=1 Tax=Roseovarius sp. MMSF_3359 TaxID=3046707 RepID=UPI00273E6CD3|nr:hypothetical protein [Roseovarius sp. MMSF_3359]
MKSSLLIWVVSSLVYAFLIGPEVARSVSVSRATFLPLGFWAPAGMFVPSLALGLLLACYMLNPLSHWRLLRPTRARVLGAIGFWFWLPVAAIALMPVVAGYISIVYFSYHAKHSDHLILDWQFVSTMCGALIASYVISCLLSSALPEWRRRTLAYLLAWSGFYWLTFATGTAVRSFL